MLTRQEMGTRRLVSLARKMGTASVTHTAKTPNYWVDTANQSKEKVRQMEGVGQGAVKGKSRAVAITRKSKAKTGAGMKRHTVSNLKRHTKPDHNCQMCNDTLVKAVRRHSQTRVPECILGPSRLALKSMEQRDEMTYAHYVNNLMDEMGGHFDENLVL